MRFRFLNQPANLESLGIDMDLETLAFLSASALAFLSAKITAGVVSASIGLKRSVEDALLASIGLCMFLLTGGGPPMLEGGGGGAVGGLGGFEAAGMLPGSTVTLVAGLAYKFPLS